MSESPLARPEPWREWAMETRATDTSNLSEVQPWLSRLPFRFQGTVFAAVRGGDLVEKPLTVSLTPGTWHKKPPRPANVHAQLKLVNQHLAEIKECPYSHTDDHPARQLVQHLRWLTLRPADPREVDHPGSYMQSRPPHPSSWKPSMLAHQPVHWYMHLAHAYEVVGYELPQPTPDPQTQWLGVQALKVYHRMVAALHLTPETREALWARMTEDRVAAGQVVS